ncbi:type III restriction enzyme, res subunit [Asticcacaulis sp. AC460]|uniref:type III restriction-modification system endonuclease n=1 Tax=Asticcacaulis sp. AC460 TaxID=1282360 RepID=UPI0003C3F04B|nr:DEAD/DEAH box helicase family protein [Asticcacaulis sp. AC460]ESQ87919.1 type III restriction enzyme, res subunit [Asticcacaulis sp. AC460]
MKLKFKVHPYQTNAVESVVDCFAGQPLVSGTSYRIDPGRKAQTSAFEEGFKNADLQLAEPQVLANVRDVQKRQNLPLSDKLVVSAGCKFNLDVEMETGTGKTYCYIKTIFEMNKRYGWSKFIIMVPSIAIREGVYKSLQITADHFTENYGKKARFFIYNSKRLHELESFSSDAGINVMVINIQAFAAKGADNRRIYDELDAFQSRRPIDVIASNRPILILDEPQKMEGKATMEALPKFKPLAILRYSATHKTQHNRIHRLDALDAYNQKLVKKIAVRGIQTRGLAGTNAYLYLEAIEISQKAPLARLELEVRLKSGEIKRQLKRLEFRDDLFSESGELDQYRDGFTISQIDYNNDTVEFTNGIVLKAGEATGDVSERDIRRIQIRETIKAHFDKEKQLFAQGIKVLSLFFIDEVVKYRDYSQADERGDYARVFEEEYGLLKAEYLAELALDNEKYRAFLERDPVSKVHEGYFAIDKQKRLVDPDIKKTGEDKGLSDDTDAYDLILKNKERLLSQDEPVRFIFSHSALREGWDNPNVFVMCMLKHSDNMISRRQEVGRGLRLSVNQNGDRMDQPAIVHDINVLTVVASESYKDFVAGLQKEIAETLSSRPRKATEAFFTGKTFATPSGPVEVSPALAKQIYRYLVKNDYTDDADQVASPYHEAKATGTLATLPEDLKPYADQVFQLIESVFSDAQLPKIDDGRKPKTNPLNANFDKREFQALWSRINQRAVYRVEFDSDELVRKCVSALDSQLRVTPLQYTVQTGIQADEIGDEQLRAGDGFQVTNTATERGGSVYSLVKYDLIGKIGELVQLTRMTVAEILTGIAPAVFGQFKENPEHFISEASRIIAEQKATMVIERLAYDGLTERYDVDIFTANQTGQDFSKASAKLKNHIYDYVVTDSDVERRFVAEIDTSNEVVVYAKLPRGFLIPTPVGDYNPDWAISFKEGSVRHVYFVAETKGTMSSMKLREIENTKIACARKFFDEIGNKVSEDRVKYDVVTDYGKLMDIVGGAGDKPRSSLTV